MYGNEAQARGIFREFPRNTEQLLRTLQCTAVMKRYCTSF